MNDPVVKAIQAGIVSIGLSDAAASMKLARLAIRSCADRRVALWIDDTDLCFNRDRVKSLTTKELKAELMTFF